MNETQVLAILNKWSNLNNSVSVRAKIISLSLNGMSNDEISKSLLTPKRKVLLWKKRYSDLGLAGLIDEQREGRKVSYKKLKAIYNFLNKPLNVSSKESITAFSKRISRSPDTVWKSARMLGITPKKGINRDFNVSLDPALESDSLVGIYFDKNLTILAFQGEKPWCDSLTLNGTWLSPHLRKYVNPDKIPNLNLIKVLELLKNIELKPFAKRAKFEIWKRWTNELIYSEPKLASSLAFKVYGDMADELVFKMLRLSHQVKPRFRATSNMKLDTPNVSIELYPSNIEHQSKSDLNLKKILKVCDEAKSNAHLFAWYRSNDVFLIYPEKQ
jgi:transposase